MNLTYALFRDILRVNVVGSVGRPPIDYVGLNASLRTRPFECDVVGINNWDDVRDRIGSDGLVDVLRIRAFDTITRRVYLDRVFLARRHISYVRLR